MKTYVHACSGIMHSPFFPENYNEFFPGNVTKTTKYLANVCLNKILLTYTKFFGRYMLVGCIAGPRSTAIPPIRGGLVRPC